MGSCPTPDPSPPAGGRGGEPGSGGERAQRLLGFLRAALGAPSLGYAGPLVPISGGFDTEIFAFRLTGAPPALAGPLVLRVLGRHHDPLRALRERAVQNALATMGFPAPRAPIGSADPGILGGAFLVMERRPGRPLLEARRPGIARVLAETQLRLHALDPDPVLRALEADAPGSSALVTLDGHLAVLEARISRGGLDGLAPAAGWLRAHRPGPGGARAVCHGDFHPQNILAEAGTVTAVLDWPNVLVTDPAYDVAATRVILGLTPLEILPMARPLRWVVGAARRLLLERYLAAYRRRRPLDPASLRYHEALACMRGLVRAAESRLPVPAGGAAPRPNPLDASSFGDRLAARFTALTGVRPVLPPAASP